MPGLTEQERTLQNLLVNVMHAREQEGARISRFLHDEVGQVLSAIGLQLDLLRMDVEEGVPDSSKRILEIQKILEQAVTQVRDLSYQLNPSVVERTGLHFALERLIGRYRKSYPGSLRLFFDTSVHVPLEIANALYKISEQALDNAVQHARSSQIEVIFKPSKNQAVLEIRDNGTGFLVEEVRNESRGLGLHLMHYHSSEAGLRLSIASAPERGTIVRTVYRVPRLHSELSVG